MFGKWSLFLNLNDSFHGEYKSLGEGVDIL